MEKLVNENFIREITPLSDKDCFYIADRHKKEFTYPMHSHKEFELNAEFNLQMQQNSD